MGNKKDSISATGSIRFEPRDRSGYIHIDFTLDDSATLKEDIVEGTVKITIQADGSPVVEAEDMTKVSDTEWKYNAAAHNLQNTSEGQVEVFFHNWRNELQDDGYEPHMW